MRRKAPAIQSFVSHALLAKTLEGLEWVWSTGNAKGGVCAWYFVSRILVLRTCLPLLRRSSLSRVPEERGVMLVSSSKVHPHGLVPIHPFFFHGCAPEFSMTWMSSSHDPNKRSSGLERTQVKWS